MSAIINRPAHQLMTDSNQIENLRQTMKNAQTNERYADAIFFADKIYNLLKDVREPTE